MKNILILAAIIAIVSSKCIIPTFGDYSDGERSGVLQKFSEKGFVFKTWEGEVSMDGFTFSSEGNSSLFKFSVTDPAVKQFLKKCIGKKVVLRYNQVMWNNIQDGSSDYFITSADTIK